MRKRQEAVAERIQSSFKKSALVHWLEEGRKNTLVSETQYSTEVLVEGDLRHYSVKDGFTLHFGKTHELMDYQVIATARKGLIIMILLEGKLDFSYDDTRFKFNEENNPQGMVVNLLKPATFRRTLKKDNNVYKINILLPFEWVNERTETNSNIDVFFSQHLANFQLKITDKILCLCKQVMGRDIPKGLLEKVQLETVIYRLFAEIFDQLLAFNVQQANVNEQLSDDKSSKHRSLSCLDTLVTYIETHLNVDLTPKELAYNLGMSESSLQRKFKQMFGYSVQSYIRRRRLEIARQHLERGIASVTEVAYSAGYRHPANFTNAFKKTFGYPPAEAVYKKTI